VIDVPYRYDLSMSSCVNKEVEAFNRRLWNKMMRFEKVES
jgi:hypothetical protein